MEIRKKFKQMWEKLSGGKKRKSMTDSELSVEEVTEEEIFPEGKRAVRRKTDSQRRATSSSGRQCAADKKPQSKHTRPANSDYRMIDPDNDTVDTGKS